MIALVLVAAPAGLRGHITRWLVEVSPGVFVGRLGARAEAILWTTIRSRIGSGQAVLIRRSDNEQQWTIESCGRPRWAAHEMDGLSLIKRPTG